MALAALFTPVILGTRDVTSVGDHTGEVLNPARVQAGQGLAALTGMEIALWGGMAGLRDAFPLWAAQPRAVRHAALEASSLLLYWLL